jgi:hypothetical protein
LVRQVVVMVQLAPLDLMLLLTLAQAGAAVQVAVRSMAVMVALEL